MGDITIRELILELPEASECIVDKMIEMGIVQQEDKYRRINEFITECLQTFAQYENWNQTHNKRLGRAVTRNEMTNIA